MDAQPRNASTVQEVFNLTAALGREVVEGRDAKEGREAVEGREVVEGRSVRDRKELYTKLEGVGVHSSGGVEQHSTPDT